MSDEVDNRPKIGICLPCYGQIPEVFFRNFILSLYEWNVQDLKIDIIMNSDIPIDKSRCALVESAKNKKCDYVFFIDTDVLIPENALKNLIEMGKDIATGIYFTKALPHRPVLRKYEDDTFFHWEDQILPHQKFKVGGAGMGCCLIKMSVFEKIQFPWFKFNWAEWRGIVGQGAEDLDFCKKALDAGFEIWANSDVLCGHYGAVADYKNYSLFAPAVQRLRDDKEELVGDIMKWYNIKDKYEVIATLKKGVSLMKEEWGAAGISPEDSTKVKEFYKTCKNYPYDLANWHIESRRDFDDRLVQEMMKINPRSVLDWGCGIAQNAIMIKKYAKVSRVVAADLDSKTLDFAKFREAEHKYGIEFLETDKEYPNMAPEKFDVILCFDVLEHLPDDEFRATIERLKEMKADNCKVFLSITWGSSNSHPMHMEGADWKMKLVNELVGDQN